MKWRIVAKRPDGTLLLQFHSNEEKVGYALEDILEQIWLYEVRGDFLIEVHDLTFPAELRSSANSSKWAFPQTSESV